VKPRGSKISVIIVTYNAAQTLEACLESIFNQRYPNIEIVVIDGQSTDGTVDILKRHSARIAFWKSEKDAGIYDAMNKGLEHATGEWIYFLGADDTLYPEFSDLADELENEHYIYYGRVMTLGGPTIPADAYAFAKYGLCHQAMIYPKEALLQRRFDQKYRISADYALNMTLFNSGEFRFIFKDHLVANFNHTGVSSTSVDGPFEKDRPAMVRKYFGNRIWLRFLFWRLKRRLKGKK
jgi:glycosyltransferase involved in cell wall biosynthesis